MDGSWAASRESDLGIVAKVLSGDSRTEVPPGKQHSYEKIVCSDWVT